MSERPAYGLLRGVEYATERLLEAEENGNYMMAIWWADARDRVIAAMTRR